MPYKSCDVLSRDWRASRWPERATQKLRGNTQGQQLGRAPQLSERVLSWSLCFFLSDQGFLKMVFRVPLESSPPSTPNKSRSFFSQGSTTPAGAPPSSARSFTPHGAPSSSTHGRSSRAGHRPANGLNESLFSMSGGMENDSIFMSSVASSDYPVPRKKQHESTNGAFAAPQSLFGPKKQARFGQPMNFGVSNGFGDSQMSGGQHEEEYDDEDMNTDEDDAVSEMVTEEPDGAAEAADDGVEEDAEERETNDLLFLDSVVGRANPVRQPTPGRRKSIYTNPDNAKRPKLDEQWAQRTPAGAANSHLQNSSLPAIARDLAARSTVAGVDEPSDVIIRTEDEICRMWDEGRRREYDDVNFDLILSEVSQDLTDIWQSSVEKAAGGRLHGAVTDIGPGENAPKFAKASFVASLLLRIHHPSTPPSARAGARFRPASQSLVQASLQTPDLIEPVPKVLLDWINTSHASRSIDLLSLGEVEPNPTASASFWDLIKTGALRGQLGDVVKILQSSDFKYARSALEDGLPQVGYRGVQLQNIQRCVNKAWQLLESSPVVQNDNWNVTGREWAVYRQRISAALADLEDFAEGQDRRLPSESAAAKGDRFQAPNFGLTSANAASNKFSFAQSARIAESHVPWAIYQSLKALYLILLGDKSAIMACSQDWVEATLALTAWWDGEDDSELTMPGPGPGGFSGRASHNLRNVGIRYVDHRPGSAYLERLLIAFSTVTDPSTEGSFRLNSMSSLEVALASIFQGNIDGVLQILQTWSLCIASAVVEIAAAGGWFISAGAGATAGRGRGAQALSNQLSENDLMVLSYGQDGQSGAVSHDAFRRDDVLVAYAAGLSARPFVENDSGTREGWEIALEVLSRLEDTETMEKGVADLLDKLPLDTAEQVDKLVLLCAELGFDKEGRRVSEVRFFFLFSFFFLSIFLSFPLTETAIWRSSLVANRRVWPLARVLRASAKPTQGQKRG